jgi:uncharacterized damage-inducible protein DinB
MSDPRYPVGRFVPPTTFDAADLTRWRAAVAAAPAALRAAVAGLDASQLDTPYRDGGWSVRQVAHHLPDSHLHTYLRFKWALSEDVPTVAGYDQAAWADLPDSTAGPVAPALALFEALHERWSALMDVMAAADFERSYVNPRNGERRSLGVTLALYAWHGHHHIAQITGLRERMGW